MRVLVKGRTSHNVKSKLSEGPGHQPLSRTRAFGVSRHSGWVGLEVRPSLHAGAPCDVGCGSGASLFKTRAPACHVCPGGQ